MTPPAFPKIPYYQGSADLLHQVRRVVCLEKLDGTNTRIGVPPDARTPADIRLGGRTLLEGEPGFNQDFLGEMVRGDAALCARLIALAAALGESLTLYGETCGARIQRMGFLYGGAPHLLLFGARVGEGWVGIRHPARPDQPTLHHLAEALHLPIAPILYEGPADSELFDALLERPSQHSLDRGFAREDVDRTQEGIVIWSDPVLCDPWGVPLVAKHKPDRRREYQPPSGDDSAEDFARRVINAERLQHARQHLEESGQWTPSPETNRDRLLRRVVQDVAREVPEYGDQLRRHGKRAVRAALHAQADALAAPALA